MPFPEPGDYADYIEKFGFRGASISEGESLLTLTTALRFVLEVKKGLAEMVHL